MSTDTYSNPTKKRLSEIEKELADLKEKNLHYNKNGKAKKKVYLVSDL